MCKVLKEGQKRKDMKDGTTTVRVDASTCPFPEGKVLESVSHPNLQPSSASGLSPSCLTHSGVSGPQAGGLDCIPS